MIATKYENDAGTKEYIAERRTRNAEAVRKVFRREAELANDPKVQEAFETLMRQAYPEMLDRIMRSLRI